MHPDRKSSVVTAMLAGLTLRTDLDLDPPPPPPPPPQVIGSGSIGAAGAGTQGGTARICADALKSTAYAPQTAVIISGGRRYNLLE